MVFHNKRRKSNNRHCKTPAKKIKRKRSINLHQLKSQSQEKSEKRQVGNGVDLAKKRQIENDVYVAKKRQKIEESRAVEEEVSSEEEDSMKQLLSTFDPNIIIKKSAAVDSSDDSSSEEEDEKNEVLGELESNEGENEGSSGEDAEAVSESEDDEFKESEDDELGESENDEEDDKQVVQGKVVEEVENNELKEEDEVDIEVQKEDEDGNITDPFAKHLFYELNDSLLTAVQSTPMLTTTSTVEWPILGKINLQIPKCEEQKKTINFTLEKEKPFASAGAVPVIIDAKQSLESIHVKSQIAGNIAKANVNAIHISEKLPLNSLQLEIFSILNNYQDLYYPHRNFDNGEAIRFVYCLHMVNHILKTRTKILHHNAKLNRKDDVPEEFRDQGLARPKILVVVPFRDSAYRIITMLIDILIAEDKGNVINKNRFLEEFTGHNLVMPKKNPKPEDYELLFKGNTGDDFRIGITVTKKSLKLFADFYSSDIIIASPLGLRTIIGADGEAERDYDFLASIELLILDQTEVFMMQNWDHLLHIFNHLHLQPKESHGTDFSRVRTWSLNGWAKYYRQTIVFSSFVLPEINAIFNKKCFNYSGKAKILHTVSAGSICKVFVQLPHVFHKFYASDVSQLSENRFQFFINKILPQQRDTLMKQTLIFVSNYFEYVRLRNYFKREDIGFVQICEYSKEGKIARARDMFFHGDGHFLLYTERFHFFNRVRIKGIRHLVFYQPPVFPHFYYEMCNLMQEANMNKKIGSTSNMTVTVLYSKYDINQLAAIVGSERAARMVQSDRNVHMLVTDSK